MMILVGILSYLLLLLSFIYLFYKKEGSFSTITVYGLSSFVFYLSLPLESVVTGKKIFIQSYSSYYYLYNDKVMLIVVLSIFSLVSFVFGYHLSRFSPYYSSSFFIREKKSTSGTIEYPLVSIIIILFFLLWIIIIFRPYLSAIGTYEGNYTITYNSPVFAFAVSSLTMFVAGFSSYLILSTGKMKLSSILLISFLLIWGTYSSNKNPILLALISGLSYFCLPKKGALTKLIWIIFGGVIFLLSFPLLSLFRTGFRGIELFERYHFSMTQIDPAGPYISLLHSLGDVKLQFGMTYLNDFFLLIPRFLWPKRPLGTAESFAQNIIPNWQPGQGLGFSPLAEAYMNFGLVGPIIQYFILGLGWGLFWRMLKIHFSRISTVYFSSLYVSVGFYLLIIMHRAPVLGIVKSMMHVVFILLFFSILFGGYWVIGRKIVRRRFKGKRDNKSVSSKKYF